jgi:hypothetical protein
MNGRFQKGMSGNHRWSPQSRPQHPGTCAQARAGSHPNLADIAKNGTQGARVSAAIALLDRAYGKPPQFNTGDTGNFRKAIDMTEDELAAIVAKARLTIVT